MPEIRLLDESIAQKIAAGEVVERPASVVKELLENAIDAGSTFITVDIAEGGIEHIRVTDNGCGIPSAEVETAFLRHATSKIQSLQDLFSITQMGFRGEALYSIAAVSQLELTTKPAQQVTGARFVINGGRRVASGEIGCPDGTTIIARNLFYNTPARLKFLNKPAIEASYVSSIVTRHILANPGISVKYINNGSIFYHSAGDGNLRNAVYTIFGKDVAQGLLPVGQEGENLTVSGYLFAPNDARGNRSRQMLFVNGRPVNNSAVSSIVERVYSGLSGTGKFPGYVLNVNLPPADVDVNVHPNKLQVRFANEPEVKQIIEIAVSRAAEHLKGQPLLWSFPAARQADGNKPDGDREGEGQSYSVAESVERLKENVRAAMGTAGFSVPGLQPVQMTLMQRLSIPNTAITADESGAGKATEAQNLALRIIGQVFDTYALVEFEDKLLILDQHAAHERLLYDKYQERLRNAGTCAQKLLIPQIINLPHEMKAVLDGNLQLLESLGFELEEYGKLSCQVRAVPFILGQPQLQDFMFELLDILSDDRALRTDELKQERVMSMACKKAVKAGDKLSGGELSALVNIISTENMPLTCPHGRPFVIILDRKSMEKQFKRAK